MHELTNLNGRIEKIAPRDVLRLLRAHQWTKNILLFLPAVLAHRIFDAEVFGQCVIAFVAFSLCASATYLFNDVIDVERDRNHPEKRLRPLASGKVSVRVAQALIPVLVISALLGAYYLLPLTFFFIVGAYCLSTLAYSLFLNTEPIIDVLLLTCFYVIRLLAGGAACAVELSPWFLTFCFFFFLGLAFLKRFVELERCSREENFKANRAGYLASDRWMLQATGIAAGLISIVIFCLYLNSPAVLKLYGHSLWMWGICPALTYWICHIWFLAQRGKVNTDPVIFALKDKSSLATALFLALLIWLAS